MGIEWAVRGVYALWGNRLVRDGFVSGESEKEPNRPVPDGFACGITWAKMECKQTEDTFSRNSNLVRGALVLGTEK